MEPQIVMDLIDTKERVYPVGRLDKETTGLLILTNDGTLTYKLTHPSSESEKEYEVIVDSKLTRGVIEKLEDGVKLWGEKTKPTRIEQLSAFKMRIILTEGKNRQIRRICQKVGCPVVKLKRIRVKNVHLADLPLGETRLLTKEEVEGLRQ
jgi:pseudouridine synthase